MSQRIPAGDLSAKLTWIWVGLLLCIFVFWKLRQVWLRHHQPLDKGAKYTQRLARRLRERHAARLKSKPSRSSETRGRD
jgi:hypothetical protein